MSWQRVDARPEGSPASVGAVLAAAAHLVAVGADGLGFVAPCLGLATAALPIQMGDEHTGQPGQHAACRSTRPLRKGEGASRLAG